MELNRDQVFIETGGTGIALLKTLWSNATDGTNLNGEYANDAAIYTALMDILGLGLLPTYQYLYIQQPDFETFEQWVITQAGGHISTEQIQQCNALSGNNTIREINTGEAVLTAEDIAFWEEHGYVIIKNAISKEDAAAARKAIWDCLQMEEKDPVSWYKSNNQMQGIMLPLYRHPAIDKNRHAPPIRRAFEQLWNQAGLIVTTDKCGFNPPETNTFRYAGIGLHWDMSLARPIPFGTQGILYLTDTAANQGALTVVPGFHKFIESWLQSLPETINPRETNFSDFNPTPIPANAGDFIIWNSKLPHSSSPNTASLPRLVQYINWHPVVQEQQERWI
jgi:Phytanoyl-CoA dioxygenase (PhyH)